MSAEKESKVGRPQRCVAHRDAVVKTVDQIVETIYMLDQTIERWSQQLNRAQPHRNGRIVIAFAMNGRVRTKGDQLYESAPVVGKMILMTSGTYRFFKLTRKDRYEKLSDLRVGKGLKGDHNVIRLIDGLEEMLKQREQLIARLNALRDGAPGIISSIQASCLRRSDEAIDIGSRIKIDWTLGAAQAEKAISDERKAKAARKKERAIAAAQATESEESSEA